MIHIYEYATDSEMAHEIVLDKRKARSPYRCSLSLLMALGLPSHQNEQQTPRRYMQIPQTHFKHSPEMSPDRYVHTRGAYRCKFLGEISECPKF